MIRRLILALALSAGLAPAFAQVAPPVPALPDTERRTSYSISASTCACNVGFALYGDSTDYANWIEVFVNGVRMTQAGNWTLSSVTGTIGSIPLPITNAVLTFTAPQTGTVQIVGARRPRRTSQFNEGAGIPTRNMNVVISDLTAQNRELWDKTNDVTGRALLSQPGNTLSMLPLPSACAGKFLGFDATGLIPQCTSGGAGSGNVVGPVSSTVGHLALWNNATGTLLQDFSGTSGGIPWFMSTGSIGTSAVLALNGVVIGGGAGATPASVAAGTNNQAFMGSTGSAPGFRALINADIATIAPQIPLVAPGSVGAPSSTGSGCNPTAAAGPVLHHLIYTDQNWCTLFDLWSMSNIEPSALMTLTVGGTVTPGDVVTLTFFSLRGSTVTASAAYTVQGGDTTTSIAAALTTAIKANATLYTPPSGGYGSGAIFAYVPASGGPQIWADFSAQWVTTWQYTVSGASTETVTSSAGWMTGTFWTGGTSGGSANAQTITISGFSSSTGATVQFVAGFSNSAAMTLNVNGAGAINVQKYVAGALVNVATGDVVAGNTYAFNVNQACGCWVIGQNSTPVVAFSTKGSQSILPNSWDATFVVQPSRVTGSNSVAPQISGAAPPGSSLWFLSPACETTDTTGILYGAITCAQIGLVSAGLAHGNVQSDWMIQTTQGGLFMFGGGLFYPGGCTYLLQPGCGLVDKGQGTINFPAYYRNNISVSQVTTQTFLSGSGTYTTPVGASRIEIDLTGGGGGGAGSATTPGAATSGGNTCWNTSGAACTTPVYQAGGGVLGSVAGATSVAGGTVAGSGTCNDSQPGGAGGAGAIAASSFGGIGGSSHYGGAGTPGWGGANNAMAAATNSGSGGGGAGQNVTANAGGGGGAGAWCYIVIVSPSATYTYAVGAAGSAGTAGTGGFAGGAGALGKVRVIEHYN